MNDKPNDLISLVCRQAVLKFWGQGMADNVFSLSCFSSCLSRVAGLSIIIDGNVCRAILCGRRDIEVLSGGCHYRLLESEASDER